MLCAGCFLLNMLLFVFLALWGYRRRLHAWEAQKRVRTQQMINYVSHEIRNPLSTILAMAELELDKSKQQQQQQTTATAVGAGAVVGGAD